MNAHTRNTIIGVIKDEYDVDPPAITSARRLQRIGITWPEVIEACKNSILPDPNVNDVVNAMRNIERGIL